MPRHLEMETPYVDLFSKPLVLVSGKGGVGKSTVIVHLARRAVAHGKTVSILSVGQSGFYEDQLERDEKRQTLLRGEPVPLFSGVTVQVLKSYPTFLEYVNLKMKIPRAILNIVRSSYLEQMFLAIPGLEATVLLGKIWHEATSRVAKNPQSITIVEAPPIGQVESFVGIYRKLHQMFRMGPLHTDAVKVLHTLHDPTFTQMVLVTVLDDIPVEETVAYVNNHHDPNILLPFVICNRVLFRDLLGKNKKPSQSLLHHPLASQLYHRQKECFAQLQKHLSLTFLALGDEPDKDLVSI